MEQIDYINKRVNEISAQHNKILQALQFDSINESGSLINMRAEIAILRSIHRVLILVNNLTQNFQKLTEEIGEDEVGQT